MHISVGEGTLWAPTRHPASANAASDKQAHTQAHKHANKPAPTAQRSARQAASCLESACAVKTNDFQRHAKHARKRAAQRPQRRRRPSQHLQRTPAARRRAQRARPLRGRASNKAATLAKDVRCTPPPMPRRSGRSPVNPPRQLRSPSCGAPIRRVRTLPYAVFTCSSLTYADPPP